MQIGVLVGPMIGGLLVAYVGIGWCFVVDVCGLLVATLLYRLMRHYPHRAETTPPSLAGIREGMRYAFGRRDLLGLLYSAETIGAVVATLLSGIETLPYSVGPLGGQVRAAITADLWSVRGAITSGGVACIGSVAITALLLRDFWSYDDRTDEHAIAERESRAAVGEA